jgi:hypothetical protein
MTITINDDVDKKSRLKKLSILLILKNIKRKKKGEKR